MDQTNKHHGAAGISGDTRDRGGVRAAMAKLTALSYGSTAAIVTSMGLIVGLGMAGQSRAAIVSSLLLVAIADNLTDSLAIHIYQESEQLEARHAFRSTVFNFLSRLVVAWSFVLLAFLLSPPLLVPLALGWGLVLLGVLTYLVARSRGARPAPEVAKHLGVALLVILASRLIGAWIVSHVA
jgi:VIT1/CCC1 family predicted Fe2+/Mn2+ transporter